MYRIIVVLNDDSTIIRNGFTTSGEAASMLSKICATAVLEGRSFPTEIVSAQIINMSNE